MLDREGRPKIVNPAFAIGMVVLVFLIYAALVPFDLVFKDETGIVFTQRGVSALLSNFEKNAEDVDGYEVVYGDGAVAYYYGEGKEKIAFSDPYTDFRLKMFVLAAKNLVTFEWEKEDFVIELYAQ